MPNVGRVTDLIGRAVYDPRGTKVGRVENVYLEDFTSEPEWITVRSGIFGSRQTFIPLHDSLIDEQRIRVAFSRSQVKECPRVYGDLTHLSIPDGRRLLAHYSLIHDFTTHTNDTARHSAVSGASEHTSDDTPTTPIPSQTARMLEEMSPPRHVP